MKISNSHSTGLSSYTDGFGKSVNDINLISDIPDEFKNVLKANFYLKYTTIKNQVKSSDGTIKFIFKLYDNLVCGVY